MSDYGAGAPASDALVWIGVYSQRGRTRVDRSRKGDRRVMSLKPGNPPADNRSNGPASGRVDREGPQVYDDFVTYATMERERPNPEGDPGSQGPEADARPRRKTAASAVRSLLRGLRLIEEDRLTNPGDADSLARVESSVLNPPRPSRAVWKPVSSPESGPYTLESLQPRQIVQEVYVTDDPTAQPEVTREVIDGVVYEKWTIPEFRQSGIPELVSD